MDSNRQVQEAMLRLSLMKALHRDFGGARDVRPGENGALLGDNKKTPAKEQQQLPVRNDILDSLPDSIWHHILIMIVPASRHQLRSSASISSTLSSSVSSTSLPSTSSNSSRPGHLSARASELKALRSTALASHKFHRLVREALGKYVTRLTIDLCNDPTSLVSMAVDACASARIHCTVNSGGRHMCVEACLNKFADVGARVSELSVNTSMSDEDCFNLARWQRSLRLMDKSGCTLPLVKSLRLRGVHAQALFQSVAGLISESSLQDLVLVGHKGRPTSRGQGTFDQDDSSGELVQVSKFRDCLMSLQVSESVFAAYPRGFQSLHALRVLDLTWVVDADSARGVSILQEGIMGMIHGLPHLRKLNIAAGSENTSPGRHAHRLHLLELPKLVEVTIGVYRMGVDDPPSKFLQSLDDEAGSDPLKLQLRNVNIAFRDLPSRSRGQFLMAYTQTSKRSRARPESHRRKGSMRSSMGSTGRDSGGERPGRAGEVSGNDSEADNRHWGRTWADLTAVSERTGITFRAVNIFGEELYRWKYNVLDTSSAISYTG